MRRDLRGQEQDRPGGGEIGARYHQNRRDTAYRFCRDDPGTHVILSGTSNPDHLLSNLKSFGSPPLPEAATRRIHHIFHNVTSVTGQ